MKYFFEAIHDIESEISAEDTTAQDLKKHLNIQQFLKTHCQSRQYTFQIKKYNVITCDFCKPIKLPLEVFESLHFLPDPEPSISDKDHYKEFNTIYGTQTSDKYRPSCMAQPEASDIPKARYSCGERLFPRDHSLGGLLFTKQALTCNSPIEKIISQYTILFVLVVRLVVVRLIHEVKRKYPAF
ncbi:unnamed protein product [Rhizophagus irregularis]|nr:unnamed protein product [Rhizophagus irregularis]